MKKIVLTVVALTTSVVWAKTKVFVPEGIQKFVPIEVKDPGFEFDRKLWAANPNAVYVTNVFHSGKSSLFFENPTPEKARAYVTQRVPIVAGAQYRVTGWIKTENVKPARVSGMKPTGATLIVEWANKKGKWCQAGEYGKALYGDNDWTKVELCQLSAPAKGGFMSIFITLRATGKAWFDDITVERVLSEFVKTEPKNGATIANNTPHFAWKMHPRIDEYFVELSQDESFPEDKTRKYSAGGFFEYQLKEPLAPGKWFWRVAAVGTPDATTSSFVQTAPVDRDCLPPLVKGIAVRVLKANDSFSVKVEDAASAAPTVEFVGVKATVGAADKDGIRVCTFAPPADGWKSGLTEAKMIAVDAVGNRRESDFFLLNLPIPENGITMDEQGFFRQKSGRVFPMAIYEVADCDLKEVRAEGFDVVHQYKWESRQDDVACRAFLDRCWATDGLRAFIGFDRGNYGRRNGLKQGNYAMVARRVGALADHPGLYLWYLYDEPFHFGQYMDPDVLAKFADLIRTLDPYHPVVVTTGGSNMSKWRDSWDTHWSQCYGDPAGAAAHLDEHRQFMKSRPTPFTMLLNCNCRSMSKYPKGTKMEPSMFDRDYDHLHALAYLPIVKGTNGEFWWWHGRLAGGHYYSAAQCPPAWSNMVKIVREVNPILRLVASEGEATYGAVEVGEGKQKAQVAWWTKRALGKDWFIAVNTADRPVTVEIETPLFGRQKYDFGRYEVKTIKRD